MPELFSIETLGALLQVVVIDLVLAGDNAVVIGLAAAGLPEQQRGKAILIGIGAATLLRILFAVVATQIMQIVGLLLAGGLLLLWVCWKMWRELRASHTAELATAGGPGAVVPQKTLLQATTQIIVADVSMSLDNVLAVAGAAREQPVVDALDRHDGRRRGLYRAAAAKPSLDRLCRPRRHSLCRHRHDNPRRRRRRQGRSDMTWHDGDTHRGPCRDVHSRHLLKL